MADSIIHISEEEVERDFAGLMARVRAGAEVVIESEKEPAVMLRPLTPLRGRLLSESIAMAEAHARELGYEPTMDTDFAADLKEIIDNRKPREPSEWD